MADSIKQPDQQEAVKEKELIGKPQFAVFVCNVIDLSAPLSYQSGALWYRQSIYGYVSIKGNVSKFGRHFVPFMETPVPKLETPIFKQAYFCIS